MNLNKQVTIQQEMSSALKEALDALTQKNYSKAADIYRGLLQLDRNSPACWINLSIALRSLGHREASIVCARRAAALNPSNPDYSVNISDCLVCLDKMDEALDILSKAVKQAPQNGSYRQKYATALWQVHKFDECLTQINIARELEPNDVEINWQYTTTHLSLGNLVEGWKNYELRWKRGNLKEQAYGVPQWAGQDFSGKTIFVHEEQGMGDTILISRYLPLVKARGGRVIFQCRTALHKLFKDTPGIDRIPEDGPLGEPFDYHVPLLSLPGLFGTTLETIPPIVKLSPSESPPEAAARLLAAGKNRLRVGIIWSGNPDFKENYKRAVSFSQFLPLVEIPGIQFYSLQKGAAEKELSAAGAEGVVWELGPHLKDFADTAAVIKELDLIIMTDSSVAHLAGSLGRPVWNLLNFSPYWLYLMDRQDSPWYPSMRLFRQPGPGDWNSVFKEVAAELKKAVSART